MARQAKPAEEPKPKWNEATMGQLPDSKRDQYEVVPPAGEIPQVDPDGQPVE